MTSVPIVSPSRKAQGTKDAKNSDGVIIRVEIWETFCLRVPSTCLPHRKISDAIVFVGSSLLHVVDRSSKTRF